jgi:hypothetical protein
MRRRRITSWHRKGVVAFTVLMTGACSIGPREEERTRPESAEAFIAYVREDLQDHQWGTILSASDPAAYQERVVVGRIPEVQFVAELFGLFRPDNTIQEGDELDWPDLERVDSVAFSPSSDTVPPFRFSGQAILTTGEAKRLDTRVLLVQGRFVLLPPAP